MSAASEVVYFELGTKELQVVPIQSLYPISNCEQVERLRSWGLAPVSFQLIDVGGNRNFMCMPLSQKLEPTNKHLATLHWGDNIPPHLRRGRWFWVGPLDTYDWRDKLLYQRLNARDLAYPFNRSQQVLSSHAELQSALTSTLPYADTSDTSLMPPLDFGPSTPFEQQLKNLRNSSLRSESSTAPLPYGSSTPFRQPGPLMAPFEYEASTARKQLGSTTAPGNSDSSTVHVKPGSSSAEKDRGPPTTPGKPDSSKIDKPSRPLNNNLSKALKQPGSRRYFAEPEPLNLFRQADQPDPLMPPFDYEPLTPLNQLRPSTPFWRSTSSTPYNKPELSSVEKRKMGPPSTTPGRRSGPSTPYNKPELSSVEKGKMGPPRTIPRRKSGPSTTHQRSGSGSAPQQKHDASQAHRQPGSLKHGPQSGSSTTAGQAGWSTAYDPEARSRAAPAPSYLSAVAEEESYSNWWSDDGHDHPDKRRGLK